MSRENDLDFSDHELIHEIRGGSDVAFERLMGRYEKLVFRIAYGYTADRESALDVTQNVFLKVHSKVPAVPAEGSLKNWIARVAANESINWRRSQRRHRATALDDGFDPQSDSSREDPFMQVERRELLRKSLLSLNATNRLAVTLRYFEGMSIREIATVLERSEGVVKNMLFRSLRRLRTHLAATTEVPS
jgi:RNA polymerase sigma-70 factor (ECF subfamily)